MYKKQARRQIIRRHAARDGCMHSQLQAQPCMPVSSSDSTVRSIYIATRGGRNASKQQQVSSKWGASYLDPGWLAGWYTLWASNSNVKDVSCVAGQPAAWSATQGDRARRATTPGSNSVRTIIAISLSPCMSRHFGTSLYDHYFKNKQTARTSHLACLTCLMKKVTKQMAAHVPIHSMQ